MDSLTGGSMRSVRFIMSLLAPSLALWMIAAPPGAAQAADPLASAAQHITILDFKTNKVLYCKDCEEPIPPASMSKLMTVLVVADKLKSGAITWDTQFPVSEN